MIAIELFLLHNITFSWTVFLRTISTIYIAEQSISDYDRNYETKFLNTKFHIDDYD